MDDKQPLVVGRIEFGGSSRKPVRDSFFSGTIIKKLRPITSSVDGNLDTIEAEGSTPSLATKSEKEIREAIARIEALLNEFKGHPVDDGMANLLDIQAGKLYALKWVVGDIEKL